MQPSELGQRIGQLQEHTRALEKELGQLKSKLASSQGDDLLAQAVDVAGADQAAEKGGAALRLKVLAARLEGADSKTLRETVDRLKDRLQHAAIVLASVADGKVTLIAGVTPAASKQIKAGELVNFVAQQVGGKGGGRPDLAQAGGTDAAALPAALAGVDAWSRGN